MGTEAVLVYNKCLAVALQSSTRRERDKTNAMNTGRLHYLAWDSPRFIVCDFGLYFSFYLCTSNCLLSTKLLSM